MGDLLLTLLKMRRASDYAPFADYYAYLNNFAASLPASARQGAASDKAFWQATLQTGLIKLAGESRQLKVSANTVNLPAYKADSEFQYHLVPAARLGMWDGRHANIPWLQEAPDQITKTVWDSWVEMHPATAAKLGVQVGDYVRITSAHGVIETQAYIYKGIQKDTIAVPMGRGHTDYGRYNVDKSGQPRGVNPLKILNPAMDSKTGELALYATRVKLEKTGRHHELVKMGGNETQLGRKLAATITSDQFNRTEGGKNDVA
jgi:molybdopterin-containing oxidoreductase family iron-sulfur binding subunit